MKNVLSVSLLAGVLLGASIGLSDAAAVSPRQLIEVADLSDPVISPDGTRVAFRLVRASIDRNTYDSAWFVQDIDGAFPPRRVAAGGVPLRNSAGSVLAQTPAWTPDGRWIYFRAFVDDRLAVWRASVDGSKAEAVTRDPADVRDFVLSEDGKTLHYSVGATRDAVALAEQKEYENGVRIDATVPVGQPLHRSGTVDGRPATQRLGYWFDRVPLLGHRPERWIALDIATRTTADVSSAGRPSAPPNVSDLPPGTLEPSRLAYDRGSGRTALLTPSGTSDGLRRKTQAELAAFPDGAYRRRVRCSAQPCRDRAITGIQWRPQSDEVLFTVTDPGSGLAQSIFRWNIRSDSVHPVVASHGLLNGGRSEASACGVSDVALVCVAAEADRPPRLERVDLNTGERTVLFEPNASLALGIESNTSARALEWTDSAGNAFTGQYFPAHAAGNVPPPLFVNYFRCSGFVRGAYGEEWPMAAMAARGISALCVNAAPNRIDAIERYELGRSAVESAIAMLASRGEIDRTRIGMGGFSFGTEVTMWTVINSDMLTAASVSSPLLSPVYYLLGSLRGDAFLAGLSELWQVGAPEETVERWKAISPVFNLDAIEAPILMQVPEQEYIKTLDYAIPLVRDHRAELHVFPDAPHAKFQPRHLLAAQTRNLDWFLFWLQGVEDPDPEKAQQYARWRDMKAAARRRAGAPVPAGDTP